MNNLLFFSGYINIYNICIIYIYIYNVYIIYIYISFGILALNPISSVSEVLCGEFLEFTCKFSLLYYLALIRK